MATKRNKEVNERRKDLERRAKRKLQRLKRKGVAVGNISPLEKVDESNTRAVKAYNARLESFIDRRNAYLAGRDGTPIPRAVWQEYKRTRKAWEKAHDKFWREFGDKRIITAHGKQDMTLREYAAQAKGKGAAFGGAGIRPIPPIEKVRGVADLQTRMEAMRNEMSEDYLKRRAKTLKQNLIRHVDVFNDVRIDKAVRALTVNQLIVLQNLTNFVPAYYKFIDTDQGVYVSLADDAAETEKQIEHLLMTIEQAKRQARKAPAKRKGAKRR